MVVDTPRQRRGRGMGRVYQPSYTDKTTKKLKRSTIWWIEYSVRGRVHRESSGSRNIRDARGLLKQRMGEVGTGRFVGRDVERTTFEDLMTLIQNDYANNGRRNLPQLRQTLIPHLRDEFGEFRAIDITVDRIEAYKARRIGEGYANATINRDLAALKRAFRLGAAAGRVGSVSHITLLKEDNVRKGFFEWEDFQRFLAEVPTPFKSVFQVAYITGWRLKSELLTRQWSHVDFSGRGWLRIEPGEDKNRSGRMFPFTAELRAVLETQRAWVDAVEKRTGSIIPWVFPREDGAPMRSYRKAWNAARKASGVNRLAHDLRRTAVRNLERAGVPRSAAMAMVGHKTEAIYRRYAIVDEAMLQDGADKLETFHKLQRKRPTKVTAFSQR